MEQLLLPVSVSEHMVFDSFYPGPNLEIYQSLRTNVQKLLWIAGTKGSGKTHLLQAAFHRCIRLSRKSLYIPMYEFDQFSPEILDDLDQLDLICIDDIEFILGNQAWERKLLDLYERLQATNTHLLIASNETPKVLNFFLPDLASRFSLSVIYQLKIQKSYKTSYACYCVFSLLLSLASCRFVAATLPHPCPGTDQERRCGLGRGVAFQGSTSCTLSPGQ